MIGEYMENSEKNYDKLVKQIGTLKFIVLIMAVALIFDSAKNQYSLCCLYILIAIIKKLCQTDKLTK